MLMSTLPNERLPLLCEQTVALVQATAQFIQGELGRVEMIEVKGERFNNLVSYVDQNSEKRLVTGLRELLPEAVFLTEEATTAAESGEWCWVIDPLDGTTNFLHQLPCFAISVALTHRGESVLGVVHNVSMQETFWAWKGGGAFLNGQPILVSERQGLNQALISTGFPYTDFTQLGPYLQVMEHFMRNTRGIRRWGAAAVDLAYVACGRYDLFFEYSLHPWDVAAGGLLITEAGGRFTDFQAGQEAWLGKEVLASSAQVYSEGLKIINRAFYGEN
jgi:myo-inositol-1(or 4)-monophosphatase